MRDKMISTGQTKKLFTGAQQSQLNGVLNYEGTRMREDNVCGKVGSNPSPQKNPDFYQDNTVSYGKHSPANYSMSSPQ